MLKEDQENAINGKQKDRVQEDTIVVSATMGKKRGKQTPTSAPSSELRVEKDGEQNREKTSLRGSESLWEVSSKDVPRPSTGILPHVRITGDNRDAISVINVLSCTSRLKVIPAQKKTEK